MMVLLSALLHPLRDISLKGVANPASAYFGVSLGWVALAGGQALLSGQSLTLAHQAWLPAVISGLALGCYYFGTLAAMRRGHLSIYYPIIRSSPLVILVLNWALFDQTYSALAALGILVIIASGFLLQKPTGRLFDDVGALGLALLAMVASAVYTLADSVAMKHAEPNVFLFWTYLIVSASLGLAWLLVKRPRPLPMGNAGGQLGWARIAFACVTSYVSYYLILTAFQLRADPAYVGAVRQASIPVSIVLATLILREPRSSRRLWWAGLLAIGIAMLTI
jgi:drug/metabolite transporter (DMT)-like permease